MIFSILQREFFSQHTHTRSHSKICANGSETTLYFTKSKWTFQKHKELSQKHQALP